MIIKKSAYDQILNFVDPYAEKETGGIIGGRYGIVTEFVFDNGKSDQMGNYYPDVDKLNAAIKDWQDKGISFYGIVHSHLSEQYSLSGEDVEYINQIMDAVTEINEYLYFPVISVKYKIMIYKAINCGNHVKIINENIIIGGNLYEKGNKGKQKN